MVRGPDSRTPLELLIKAEGFQAERGGEFLGSIDVVEYVGRPGAVVALRPEDLLDREGDRGRCWIERHQHRRRHGRPQDIFELTVRPDPRQYALDDRRLEICKHRRGMPATARDDIVQRQGLFVILAEVLRQSVADKLAEVLDRRRRLGPLPEVEHHIRVHHRVDITQIEPGDREPRVLDLVRIGGQLADGFPEASQRVDHPESRREQAPPGRRQPCQESAAVISRVAEGPEIVRRPPSGRLERKADAGGVVQIGGKAKVLMIAQSPVSPDPAQILLAGHKVQCLVQHVSDVISGKKSQRVDNEGGHEGCTFEVPLLK